MLGNARHILLTGASGAIGSALLARLVPTCPRAHCSLVDRDASLLTDVRHRHIPAGRSSSTHGCDLSQPPSVDALLEECAEAASGEPVDVLINCAGIMEMRTLTGTPWELAQRVLDIDLVSPLRLMARAAPSMQAEGRGWIVNISSMAGVTPLRGATYYGAAKAGLAMASEIAAIELREQGVHVTTVYPGPVSSALEAHARSQLPETFMTRVLPTGRAEPLADRIVAAMASEGRTSRVVYPPLYSLADRVPRLAGRITRWLSPRPHV